MRVEYFGVFFDLAITDFFAMDLFTLLKHESHLRIQHPCCFPIFGLGDQCYLQTKINSRRFLAGFGKHVVLFKTKV